MPSKPPFFPFTSHQEQQRQFAIANSFFSRYPGRHKLPRTNKANNQKWLLSVFGDKKAIPKTTQSFRLVGNKVLALPNKYEQMLQEVIVGVGAGANCKYAYDETGKEYVLKIEKKDHLKRRVTVLGKDASIEKRVTETNLRKRIQRKLIAKDLGVLIEEDIRDHLAPKEIGQQSVMLMPHLGQELFEYLAEHWKDLEHHQRYTIAIKVSWAVTRLHQGWSSKSGKPYAHGDIKPENITIDKRGDIHLIDFEFADDPERLIDQLCGTRRYLPYDILLSDYSLEQKDQFALCQTLYLPPMFKHALMKNNTPVKRDDRYIKILTDEMVIDAGLKPFITPSAALRPSPLHSTSFYTALLILASINRKDCYSLLSEKKDAEFALMTLYFSGELNNISKTPLLLEKLLISRSLLNFLVPYAKKGQNMSDKDRSTIKEKVKAIKTILKDEAGDPIIALLDNKHGIDFSSKRKKELATQSLLKQFESNPDIKTSLLKDFGTLDILRKRLTKSEFRTLFTEEDIFKAVKEEAKHNAYSLKGLGIFALFKKDSSIIKTLREDHSKKATQTVYSALQDAAIQTLPFLRDKSIQLFYSYAYALLNTIAGQKALEPDVIKNTRANYCRPH